VTPDFSLPISPPRGNQDRAASAREQYPERIEQGPGRGRNGKANWQDPVSDHGFSGSYQKLKRFARKLHGRAQADTVRMIQTVAGEKAQADYGSGPMVRDPQSGKYLAAPFRYADELLK
jgi:hypothetical protein